MARANRVIQKPKPPSIRHMALIDPNTGVISGYASGTNIVIGDVESQHNWKDITDVPGAASLSSEKIRRVFMKDGKIKRKPRVRLVIDSRKIEIGKGKAKVSFEVLEGEVEDLNLVVHNNGNTRKEKLHKNQHLEISASSRRKVVVTVDDPLIFVEGPVATINIVPPEELTVQPSTPVVVIDDLVVGKKN